MEPLFWSLGIATSIYLSWNIATRISNKIAGFSTVGFWVTTDSLSSQAGITTEVMIWMDRNIINPAGSLIASVNFDGFEYKVYRANWDSWTYIAFLSTETQYSGLLAVHNFVHYLVNEGLLNADEYFADFEMGKKGGVTTNSM